MSNAAWRKEMVSRFFQKHHIVTGATLACKVSLRDTALLLTGDAADWSVRKGALWWFTCRMRGGYAETVLRAVIAPDLV